MTFCLNFEIVCTLILILIIHHSTTQKMKMLFTEKYNSPPINQPQTNNTQEIYCDAYQNDLEIYSNVNNTNYINNIVIIITATFLWQSLYSYMYTTFLLPRFCSIQLELHVQYKQRRQARNFSVYGISKSFLHIIYG